MPRSLCPYCRCAISGGEASSTCPTCQSVYHADCLDEAGGCVLQTCAFATAAAPNAFGSPATGVCTECGRTVGPSDRFCTSCGTPTHASDEVASARPSETRVCSRCSFVSSGAADFCTKCGNTLRVASNWQPPVPAFSAPPAGSPDIPPHAPSTNVEEYAPVGQSPQVDVSAATSMTDQIKVLAELHERGLLSSDEFTLAKARLLS